MTDQLLERTKALLTECELPLPELARRAGVGYEWLKKFAAGDIPDPRVKRLQKLHDFLVQYLSNQTAPQSASLAAASV